MTAFRPVAGMTATSGSCWSSCKAWWKLCWPWAWTTAACSRPSEQAAIGPWRSFKGVERGGPSPRGGRGTVARLARLVSVFVPDLLAFCADSGRVLMSVQDHRVFCPGLGKLTPRGRYAAALRIWPGPAGQALAPGGGQ